MYLPLFAVLNMNSLVIAHGQWRIYSVAMLKICPSSEYN